MSEDFNQIYCGRSLDMNVNATVNVGVCPWGIAVNPAGTRVYVTIHNSTNVSVIDTATNSVIDTLSVGIDPCGVAVTPDGTKIYVANGRSNNVFVIDTATNTVTATVNVGNGPCGIAGHFIDPVTKSNSTMESNSTLFLNPITQTENQTNNTGMKEESSPFMSPIWVLAVVLGTVKYVIKKKQ